MSVNVTTAANGALLTRRRQQVAFLKVVAWNHAVQPPASVDPPVVVRPAQHAAPVQAATSLLPCGGDLPPCYVVARESGGDYNAYNPSGCDGGCIGKYQFSEAWRGKLLPAEGWPTPAQQDEAARELWNGGAGCSNWNAC